MTKVVDRKIPEKISTVSIVDFVEEHYARYGSSVIENRALSDYRDGFKPVQRRILWDTYVQKLWPNGSFTKSSAVVGDTMAKFHPHGDLAIYGSLVTMVNLSVPLMDKQGNFGTLTDPNAAAMRYTETRMARYTAEYILNPAYLVEGVITLGPNYDGKHPEPNLLPSLLPTLLFIGSEGIAVGVASRIPPYYPSGVLYLVANYLKTGIVTAKQCIRSLEFNYKYGAECWSTETELLSFYNSGTGNLLFGCRFERDLEAKKLRITGVMPYFDFEGTEKRDKKTGEKKSTGLKGRIQEIAGVRDCYDASDEKDPILFVVELNPSLSTRELPKVYDEIEALLCQRVNFQVNVCDLSQPEGKRYLPSTVPNLIMDWTEWRIELETRYLQHQEKVLLDKIHYNQVLRRAADPANLDIIFRILKSFRPKGATPTDSEKVVSAVPATKELIVAAYAKGLKMPVDDARIIAELSNWKLSRLSADEYLATIKKLKQDLDSVRANLRKPKAHLLKWVESIMHDKKKIEAMVNVLGYE